MRCPVHIDTSLHHRPPRHLSATYLTPLRRLVESLECFLVQHCIAAWVLVIFAGLPRFIILLKLVSHQSWDLAHEGLALNRYLHWIILLVAVLVRQPFLKQCITKDLFARKFDFSDLLLVRELNLRPVPGHMELHAGDQVVLILLPLLRVEYLLDTISSHLRVVKILR